MQIAHWKLPSLTLSAFSFCRCCSISGILFMSLISIISDSLSESALSKGSEFSREAPDVRLLFFADGAEGLDDGTSMAALLLRFLEDIVWAAACVVVERGSVPRTEGIEAPWGVFSSAEGVTLSTAASEF